MLNTVITVHSLPYRDMNLHRLLKLAVGATATYTTFYCIREMLKIASSFCAKVACSNLHLSNRNIQSSINHELSSLPHIIANIKLDINNEIIECNSLGMRSKYSFSTTKGATHIKNNFKPTQYKSRHSDHSKTKRSEETDFALLAYRGQDLIFEKYADGFTQSTRMCGWSISKSITSILVGIAQKQEILDINQPIGFESWRNDERSKITWAHLLEMSDGLRWSESYTRISDVTKMLFLSRDMGNYCLGRHTKHAPGTFWNYSSGSSNLLSLGLKKALPNESEYLRFPYEQLAYPLGMNSFFFERDSSNTYIGSSYAWATARDWGKFALALNQNTPLNSMSVIPADWLLYCNTLAKACKTGEYGAHFWLNKKGVDGSLPIPGHPEDMLMCKGYNGQRIYVIPSLDLTLLRFGTCKTRTFDDKKFLDRFLNILKDNY